MNVDAVTFQIFQTLKKGLLHPINEFMDDNCIVDVCEKFKFHNHFFPIPLFITAKSEDLKKMRNNILELSYKNKIFGSIKVKKIFLFDKKIIEDKIFKDKNIFHPYKDLLKSQNDFFLNAEILNDETIKKNIFRKRNIVGFASRNAPHIGHKKIILNQVLRGNKVLVAIFNDSSIKTNDRSDIPLFCYKKFIKKNNLHKKVFVKKISMPGFLLGPRQASLQAIIMKNLGCSSFIVGRDHSGYKNFYKENDSYKFCKKNEKIIGIKIFKSGSPFYCLKCQKVMLRSECNCCKISKNFFIDISSTFIKKINNSSKLKKKFKNLLN